MTATTTIREYRSEAIRYWERGRIIYLVVLAIVTLTTCLMTMDQGPFRAKGPFHDIGILFGWVAAFVGANLCYSVVYLLEFLFMGTVLERLYRACRWVLLIVGCAFGAALAFVMSYSLFAGMRASF